MSALYGELSGAGKTTATRRGTEQSGISAHVRGWNVGVYASIMAVCDDDKRTRHDPGAKRKYRMVVEITGGSDKPMDRRQIHTEEWEE